MTIAEIISIGTEILLGELVDTNSTYIARQLRDLGIDLYRKTSVGDNSLRIAQAVQQALERCQVIITTGGLGPTIDDPTREAIAIAMGVEIEYLPELWDQIITRFERFGRKPTENNRRQAFIPSGAIPVENPVGTAPAFIYETAEKSIISLPGVPREMEYLMQNAVIPYLRERFPGNGVIKSRILHTAGVGESQIDDLIADFEQQSNPTVGLAAHSGQVDVRITAKADDLKSVDQMITELEGQLRDRLGKWIYGADGDTLVSVALQAVQRHGWTLAVVESGLGGDLIQRLAAGSGVFVGGEVLTDPINSTNLPQITTAYRKTKQADVGLGVMLVSENDRIEITIVLVSPDQEKQISRPFGGAPLLAPIYAINYSLNLLRNI
jgi:competence/damage-inducible protein CinA-like protein